MITLGLDPVSRPVLVTHASDVLECVWDTTAPDGTWWLRFALRTHAGLVERTVRGDRLTSDGRRIAAEAGAASHRRHAR
jgi:hypothetical protein